MLKYARIPFSFNRDTMTIQTNALQANESEALCNARCTYLRGRSISNLYLRYL